MSLFSIARNPLMWGGDPLTSSEKSVSFLQNKEVLAVNQDSDNNRQLYDQGGHRAWIADVPGAQDKYFALFNLNEKKENVKFFFEWDMLRGKYQIRDLWDLRDLGVFEQEFSVELDPHGAGLYRMAPQ